MSVAVLAYEAAEAGLEPNVPGDEIHHGRVSPRPIRDSPPKSPARSALPAGKPLQGILLLIRGVAMSDAEATIAAADHMQLGTQVTDWKWRPSATRDRSVP